jgi:hypothetical protein
MGILKREDDARHIMVAEGSISARYAWFCSAKNEDKPVFNHVK